jgi:hypothetical protein
VNVTGIGRFDAGPIAYSFGASDTIGVVVQGNAGFASSGGQAKFTVHVRLTP